MSLNNHCKVCNLDFDKLSTFRNHLRSLSHLSNAKHNETEGKLMACEPNYASTENQPASTGVYTSRGDLCTCNPTCEFYCNNRYPVWLFKNAEGKDLFEDSEYNTDGISNNNNFKHNLVKESIQNIKPYKHKEMQNARNAYTPPIRYSNKTLKPSSTIVPSLPDTKIPNELLVMNNNKNNSGSGLVCVYCNTEFKHQSSRCRHNKTCRKKEDIELFLKENGIDLKQFMLLKQQSIQPVNPADEQQDSIVPVNTLNSGITNFMDINIDLSTVNNYNAPCVNNINDNSIKNMNDNSVNTLTNTTDNSVNTLNTTDNSVNAITTNTDNSNKTVTMNTDNSNKTVTMNTDNSNKTVNIGTDGISKDIINPFGKETFDHILQDKELGLAILRKMDYGVNCLFFETYNLEKNRNMFHPYKNRDTVATLESNNRIKHNK